MNRWKKVTYKKTALCLAVLFLLALYCIVRLLLPRREVLLEGSMQITEENGAKQYVVYENIALSPGVYDIRLCYESDTDSNGLCTVWDGTVFHGGLLTNGETVYSALPQTDFCMWLFESTQALQVSIHFNGQGTIQTGNLVIAETGKLWSMLLTVIVLSAGALIVGMGFGRYKQTHPFLREQKNVIFGLGVAVLLASIPYLYGSSVSGADFTYHLQRIEGVKDGLLSGQFPVRLEPEWVFGHGYANGIFYCNSLLYLPAILRLLGFTVTTSYNVYGIVLNTVTVLIAYYCFSRIFKNRYIGLICSTMYVLSIVRINVFVITSAVGEGSAMTFMPLIMYGLYRVFTEDTRDKKYKTAWIPVAFGYAGLMQTHVLSCEITAFLTGLVCIVFIKKVLCLPTFLELAKGAAGAVVMSLWYLVPFLDYFLTEDMHIRHVSGRTIQERGLFPAQLAFHFWPLGNNAMGEGDSMQYSHALGVGFVLVLGFVIFFMIWYGGGLRQKKDPITRLGKISFLLGGMLLLMSLNVFPWDFIQNLNSGAASLVSSLQFPKRFLTWGTVFLTAVFGCCLHYFLEEKQKWGYYLGVTAMLLGIATSSLYLMDHVGRDHDRFWLYNEEGMGAGYISGAEYLVEGTEPSVLTFANPTAGRNVKLEDYEKKYLTVRMSCTNTGEGESYVELPLLHYTGYRACGESTGKELAAVKGSNNLVRIILPEGFCDTVKVWFASPVYWRVSEAVSCVGWPLILVTCARAWGLTGRHKQKQSKEGEGICAKV